MKHATSLSQSFAQTSKLKVVKKKRPAPISVRVSEEERERLTRDAAGRSVNSYIRARLFSDDTPARTRGRAPIKDYEALARALSLMGRSDIYTSLSALVLAIEQQKLEASAEVEADIRDACTTVCTIRAELIKALGLKG